MRQLTSLDAQFLALENDRHVGHVGSLAILDPATAPGGEVTCRSIRRLIRERLPALPPLRWRVREVPLGLDYPFWVEDPDFDLDYHVRELALPRPGSDRQLAAQVARIVSRPLDRARPLWELYVVEGLASGFVGVLDEDPSCRRRRDERAEVMGLLLDLEPHARPRRPAVPRKRRIQGMSPGACAARPAARPRPADPASQASSRCSPAAPWAWPSIRCA